MVIIVNEVVKKIGRSVIIKDVSFTINKGEIVAIVGPNGSGKTTLFKLMTSLLHLDEGSIKINKIDLQRNRTEYLEQISFMQDSSILYQNLTGYDHLKFISNIKRKSEKDIMEIIKELKVEEYIHKKVKTYSLGMKQYLLLGISMLANPTVLLLDEPLNGLDPISAEKLHSVILNLRNNGTTILFSSHNLSQVDKIADRILFICKGEIIREVYVNRESEMYKFIVSSKKEMIDILKGNIHIIDVQTSSSEEIQLTIKKGYLSEILKVLSTSDIDIIKIDKSEQTLDNIYRKIYGGEL
ncbi:ABC transporter ATP-binding protein [Lysinibacillus sp. NPDC047702]|uniref:ABC transporter ATP-binding protein n=1 Tax=unclassified Lysinibacillus TaxID=2636778 RepID=UPI003CFDB833